MNELSREQIQYVEQFSAGQQAFVEQQAEQTVAHFEAGDVAGAIVEGRKLTAVPKDVTGIVATVRRYAAIESLMSQRGTSRDADIIAFADKTRLHIPEVVPQAIERARLLIYGREAIEWTEALGRYNTDHEFHSAAISALELADAHQIATDKSGKLSEPQLSAYTIAADSARHRLAEIPTSATNAAEQGSATSHLVAALQPTVDHYLTYDRVQGEDRDWLMRSLYELDDLTQLSDEFLKQSYELLVRSTRSNLRARGFFKKEVASANDRLEVERLRRKGRGYFVGFRTDRPPHDQRPKPRT